MKVKNKLSFFIILLGLFSCHKLQDQSVILSKWLPKTYSDSKVINRHIAVEEEKVDCFSHRFKIDSLKDEISFYEKREEKQKKIKGKWKHLDLEKLSVPQARFLNKKGDELGDLKNPDAIDFSHCENVVCLINSVYNFSEDMNLDVDRIEGYAIYLWYLKMGYSLGVKNKIYPQRSNNPGRYNCQIDSDTKKVKEETCTDFSLRDYLFSVNELYGFWKLSHSLPSLYLSLSGMVEISRVPRKGELEGHGALSCGVAWSSGYILLEDSCLSFKTSKNRDEGFFYESITHEMTHQIDFSWSEKVKEGIETFSDPGTLTIFSESELWWKYSGWRVVSETKEDNKIVKVLKSDLKNEEFVSHYSRTTPTEHFADTGAYYRFYGEKTFNTIPTSTYDFYKENIFSLSDYNNNGLVKNYLNKSKNLFQQDIFSSAFNCTENPVAQFTTGEEISLSKYPDLSLTPSQKKCLKKKINELNLQMLSDIKLNEPDACIMLDGWEIEKKDFQAKYQKGLSEQNLDMIVGHIRVAQSVEGYYEKLKKFYKNLNDPSLSMKMYFECHEDSEPESCFKKKVEEYITELIPSGDFRDKDYFAILQKLFLETHQFNEVRDNTLKTFKDFISFNVNDIDEVARASWKKCLPTTASDVEAPHLGKISMGEDYLVSSFLNCLNNEYNLRIEEVFSKLTFNGEELGGTEKKVALPHIESFYQQEIQKLYQKSKQDEKTKIDNYIQIRGSSFIEQLKVGAITLVKEGKLSEVHSQCVKEYQGIIQIEFYYHLKKDFLNPYANSTCTEIINSQDLKTELENNSTQLMEVVKSKVLKKIDEMATDKAEVCIKKFPSTTTIEKIKAKPNRESCLKEGWSIIVDSAIEKVLESYISYKFDRAQLKLKAKEKEKIQQDKVIFRKF